MALPPDPIAAVVDFLKSDSDIAFLTRNSDNSFRVYGGKIPLANSAAMPQQSVVVQPSGGRKPANYSQFYWQRVDIRAYGATEKECGDLMLCCIRSIDALTTQKRKSTKLYAATMEAGRYSGVDAGTFWPFEFVVYSVATHLAEA